MRPGSRSPSSSARSCLRSAMKVAAGAVAYPYAPLVVPVDHKTGNLPTSKSAGDSRIRGGAIAAWRTPTARLPALPPDAEAVVRPRGDHRWLQVRGLRVTLARGDARGGRADPHQRLAATRPRWSCRGRSWGRERVIRARGTQRPTRSAHRPRVYWRCAEHQSVQHRHTCNGYMNRHHKFVVHPPPRPTLRASSRGRSTSTRSTTTARRRRAWRPRTPAAAPAYRTRSPCSALGQTKFGT